MTKSISSPHDYSHKKMKSVVAIKLLDLVVPISKIIEPLGEIRHNILIPLKKWTVATMHLLDEQPDHTSLNVTLRTTKTI